MSCLLNTYSVSVGASGALMGLLGGWVAETIMSWSKTDPMVRKLTLFQALLWITVTMLFGFSQFVDSAAHFGGVVTGFIVGCSFFAYHLENESTRKIIIILSS